MKELRKAIVEFIWAHKTPRIKRENLIRKKRNGGLALPDCVKYLQAASLTSIIDWYHNNEKKQSVSLEEEIIGPQLKALPWVEPHLRPKRSKLTLFVSATLKVWDGIVKGGKLSTIMGPMTPLFFNPEFPPAMRGKNFLKWNRSEDIRLAQVLENGKLPTLRDMGEGYEKKWLQYQQLQTFIEPKIARIIKPLTGFEKLLLGEQDPTKKLSKIYDELIPISPLKEITSIK